MIPSAIEARFVAQEPATTSLMYVIVTIMLTTHFSEIGTATLVPLAYWFLICYTEDTCSRREEHKLALQHYQHVEWQW